MKITKKQAIKNIEKYEAQKKSKQSQLVFSILNLIYDKIDSGSREGQKEIQYTFTTPANVLITVNDTKSVITELQKDGWDASCTPLVSTRGGGSYVEFTIKIMD